MVNDSELKEFEGIKNVKIVDGKKVFNCTMCGKCCYFREDKNITKEDEQKYYDYMYSKYGILYLAPLSDITINVWPEEAEKLRRIAIEKGVDVKLRPKRAVYDEKNNELIILDYFIDHDVCPFFDKKKRTCGVYDDRPLICRAFPLLSTKTTGNCEYKLFDTNEYADEQTEAKKLEKMVDFKKKIIQ